MTLKVDDINSQWQPQSVAVRYTTDAWFRESQHTQNTLYCEYGLSITIGLLPA